MNPIFDSGVLALLDRVQPLMKDYLFLKKYGPAFYQIGLYFPTLVTIPGSISMIDDSTIQKIGRGYILFWEDNACLIVRNACNPL